MESVVKKWDKSIRKLLEKHGKNSYKGRKTGGRVSGTGRKRTNHYGKRKVVGKYISDTEYCWSLEIETMIETPISEVFDPKYHDEILTVSEITLIFKNKEYIFLKGNKQYPTTDRGLADLTEYTLDKKSPRRSKNIAVTGH